MDDDIGGGEGTPPDLNSLAKDHVDQIYDVKNLSRLERVIANAIQTAIANAVGAIVSAAPAIGRTIGKVVDEGEEDLSRIMAPVLGKLVGLVLGVEVPLGAIHESTDPEHSAVGDAIGAVAFKAISGGSADTLTPSDEPAKHLLGVLAHIITHCWAEGIVLEKLEGYTSWSGHIETIAQLGKDLVDAMGLSRVARVALRPLAHTVIATPLQWKVYKQYRPTLLGEAEIVRAFLAGDYSQADAREELSRLGYSDRRQDVLLKHATKFLSAADALVLIRDGQYDRQFAIENLRAQGYDQVGAEQALLIEEVKHLNGMRDDSVASIKAAYVDRRISDGQLDAYLGPIYANDEDRSAHATAFRTIRDLNTKRLSPSQAEACVKAGVMPIAAYRESLRLDGFDEESVLALELLLETQLNSTADVEKLRQQKLDDAAAKKAAADEAAKKRAADVEAQRALARRGSLSELARAVVRGLIPTSRYAEVLSPQYDADTVATMVALVEQDRAAYVVQQQKAEDAAKRATLRHIDVGALQAAYLAGVLTLDQIGTQLQALNFDPADAQILLATMQARKADLDAAKRQRDAAAAAAKTKSINLTTFEALVRRGHRSIPEYSSLLSSLGFDAGATAAMVELLQLQIADDDAARKARADAAAKSTAQGLTLEQLRRAVILGVSTADDYQRYLTANKFTLDAQTVLMAELREDVAQADAARAKRKAADDAAVETRAPLSTIARAARLGIVSPDVYAQRLTDAGYVDDDIAIEMDLLAVEIADTQAARARAAAAEAAAGDRGLTLDQVAKAVKVGAATLDDYRARAAELNYAADDVATLVAVLADELQAVRDAEARHSQINDQLKLRNLSLSELDDAVKNGLLTIDAYTARLVALGFGTDDADLLTTLLLLKLPAPPDAGATS